MATTTPAPAEHEHGHPSIVLATLALANVMGVLDLFIVNVALHGHRLGPAPSPFPTSHGC